MRTMLSSFTIALTPVNEFYVQVYTCVCVCVCVCVFRYSFRSRCMRFLLIKK
jgi:hypothetical protein